MLINNSRLEPELIAEGLHSGGFQIINEEKWVLINKLVENDKDRHKG
jgi:hypothetical protein